MSVYVGKDVEIKLQLGIKEEVVSAKLMQILTYGGVTQSQTGSHEAYDYAATSEPNPPFGDELDDTGYRNIRSSDDSRHSKATSVNGEFALMLFRFKCPYAEADVKKIVATFEGYGTAPDGNGVTMKIWDHVSSAWSNAVSGTGGSDETLTITLTSNLGNYIDADGYIWVLARTTNPSDGVTAATLYCDYAQCFVTRAKFTVNNIPISDRDMDGVADEAEHVTVKVNDTEATVNSVDDDQGIVELASGDFNEDDRIVCTYRYDYTPYIAQELTVEPKQRIEGLDGLGSDTVQIWVPLLKEINGAIKEVFKPGDQTQIARAARTVFLDTFENDANWEPKAGTWTITSDKKYHGNAGTGWAYTLLKNIELADFYAEFKIKNTSGMYATGLLFRYQNSNQFYCFGLRLKQPRGVIFRKRNTAYSDLALYPFNFQQNVEYTLKILAVGNNFYCFLGDKHIFTVEDSSFTYGRFGFICENIYTQTSFDDLKIVSPPFLDNEHGMIVSWSQGGSTVKIGLNNIVFPEGSIPAPKNEPVYIVTPFKAQSIKVIT